MKKSTILCYYGSYWIHEDLWNLKFNIFFRQKDQKTTVLSLVQAKNVWKRYSLSIYLCNLLNNSHITYSEKNLCGNMILFFLAIERKSNYEKLKEIWHIQNQAKLSQESHTCGCNSWLFGGEGRYRFCCSLVKIPLWARHSGLIFLAWICLFLSIWWFRINISDPRIKI